MKVRQIKELKKEIDEDFKKQAANKSRFIKVEIAYPVYYVSRQKSRRFQLEVESRKSNEDFLEELFAGFNAGSGVEWDIFQSSKCRSLSVGDFVKLDDTWYQCASVGWMPTTEEKVNLILSKTEYNPYLDDELMAFKPKKKIHPSTSTMDSIVDGLITIIHQNTRTNDLHHINDQQCKDAVKQYLTKFFGEFD